MARIPKTSPEEDMSKQETGLKFQEVLDMIEGNMNRQAQLIQMLRQFA